MSMIHSSKWILTDYLIINSLMTGRKWVQVEEPQQATERECKGKRSFRGHWVGTALNKLTRLFIPINCYLLINFAIYLHDL